jgi:AcrR family transcriptional regulator
MSASAQRTKRRQHREETRRQILQAARELLEDHSFRDIGVDAVMAKTGHSRTVFYRHFDDLPSMVLALIGETGGELVELSEAWEQTDRVGPEEAHDRLSLFVDFYVRNGRLVRAVTEAAHHDELVQQAYAGMMQGFMDLTARAVDDRLQRGELEPIDGPEVARALVWMLNGYLNDRLGGPEQADPERVLEAVWTIWTRTLFPRAS